MLSVLETCRNAPFFQLGLLCLAHSSVVQGTRREDGVTPLYQTSCLESDIVLTQEGSLTHI